MEKYRYKLIEEQMLMEEDDIPYTAYGISLEDGSEKISDISCDRAFVRELVKKINKVNLPPYQLADIVDDAIA